MLICDESQINSVEVNVYRKVCKVFQTISDARLRESMNMRASVL